MMKTIELSARQRREIRERRRQAGDRRIFQRLSALLWIDEGRTREEVADLLGVTSRLLEEHEGLLQDGGFRGEAAAADLLRDESVAGVLRAARSPQGAPP